MPRTKRCSACETRKQITSFGRGGLDSWCRTCRLEYQRRWLAAHRDSYNQRHRAYYRENRDRLREYNREYQRRRRALMQAGKWKVRPRRSLAGERASR